MIGTDPVPMPGEVFVLSRDGIAFSAKSGRTKFEGKGFMQLSTLRIVFVASRRGGSLQAFDIPLATMRRESFNQPIFGANNLTGTSPPLQGSSCEEDIQWKFAFNEGGVGTFLPIFFRLLQDMRQRMQGYDQNHLPTPMATPVVQQIVQAAYVDPNDPSKLYVSVPSAPAPQAGVPVAVATPVQ